MRKAHGVRRRRRLVSELSLTRPTAGATVESFRGRHLGNTTTGNFHVRQVGSDCVVELEGVIDETFQREKLSRLSGVVVLDLAKVKRITSFGVREWINGLRESAAEYYCFVNARPALVAQFNMVSGFAGRGQLVSFFAPYLCPTCNKQLEELVDLRKQHAMIKSMTAPPVDCPTCNTPAEFDDLPDGYFAYVAGAPLPALPPRAEALLEGSAPGTPSVWKVEKQIEGTVTAIWLSGPLDKRSHLKRLADGLEGDVVVLLSGITSVTLEGLQLFQSFSESAKQGLLFARVPRALAEQFVANPKAVGRARISSFRLPYGCESCKQPAEVDVDPTDLELDAVGIRPNCVGCGQILSPAPGLSIEALTRLPLEVPSEHIREYLRDHAYSPAQHSVDAPGEAADVWGKYRLVKQIGSGGMAQVFLARQIGPEGFEKKVVLKRMQPHLSDNPVFVEMFLEEARLAARLSHPNVVQIFDLGKIYGQYYIAMEYVRGWDLSMVFKVSQQLKEPIPLEIAARIVADVCAALAAAHRRTDDDGIALAIVHRDVSPQNVLISTDGVSRLTDFGVAKALGTIKLTEPGMIRGKVGYMSPEQVQGSADVDERTDLFAAGVVLWQCVTGQMLFERDNQAATMMAVMQDPIPPVSRLRPKAAPLDAIIARALERDAMKRYQAAEHMQRDLEGFLFACGKPSTPAHLAAWLQNLFKAAKAADVNVPASTSSSHSTEDELTMSEDRNQKSSTFHLHKGPKT